MTLPFRIPWHHAAEDRVGRLCRLLDRAHVAHSRDIPEAALESLPLSDAPGRSARRQLQRFQFPLAMPARVALFENGFSPDGAIRQFSPRDAAELKEYVPEALVSPLPLVLLLADQKMRRLVEFPTLTRAIVVLTSIAGMPITEQQRTLLWRAFGVPQFEQLRGYDGTVLARECEVHDGLHIDENAVVFQKSGEELIATQLTGESVILRVRTGLTASIVTEHCECGAETPRLRGLASLHAQAHLAVA
ncbi:MAG TPA: hypothetical protein VG273_08730 [Bryobacteraceae bacterium]|jgi:hypothetical protein|nr:hypothetical protein [Bryobacteraceae bacterium]